jgi:hypothetical protein
MRTSRLVFVRADTVYSRDNDFKSPVGRVCEPLVLDVLGHTWVATGERDERGHMLYEAGMACRLHRRD